MSRILYNWPWQKLYSGVRRSLALLGLLSCLLIYTAGCSGTVAYHLEWQDVDTLAGTPEMIDCEATGVKQFHAYVYEPDYTDPIEEISWSCTETPQPIYDVSSGENYKVVVIAEDANEYAMFVGEQDKVQVLSDTINNVGNIKLIRFSASLAGKTEHNRLSWSKVKYAKQYRIQIAEDIKFENVIVDRVVEETSYAPGLVESQVYFWRIAPISSTGFEGRLSETWSFRF